MNRRTEWSGKAVNRRIAVRRMLVDFYGQKGELPNDSYMLTDQVHGRCPAERNFLREARKRGYGPIQRDGWPDFLLHVPARGICAVEVKSLHDMLSKRQVATFSMLEHAGIRVLVWWEGAPDRLLRWRKYWRMTGKVYRNEVDRPRPRVAEEGDEPAGYPARSG